MIKDYEEKILEVNLSTKQTAIVNIDKKVLRNFIGGLGLGVKILYDEVGPGVDPFSAENVIVFVTGALSGTTAPTAGKTQVITKSPLNEMLGIGTFGGFWGHRLKYAGLLAIVVRGKSDNPVYLWIHNDEVELKSADHLWGKDSWEATDALKEKLGNDISVLTIGQAGENLVRFACPVVDYDHTPGRCNAGGVMGFKKLKAIAVRGRKKPTYYDYDKFKKASKEASTRIVRSAPHEGVNGWGYFKVYAYAVTNGGWSAKNWQIPELQSDNDILHWPESVKPHLKIGRKFCYICPNEKYLGCRRVADVKEGPYSGTKVGGVFCWTQYPGITYWMKSYPAMFKYVELCQRYGLDRMGPPIGFAMELFQRKILKKEDCDGLELNWGDEAVVFELLRKTAYREGFGNLLAEGNVRMAEKIGKGSKQYSMTIKGGELMMFDPRTWGPMGENIGAMVNPRGGDDQLITRGSWSGGLPEGHKRVKEKLNRMGFSNKQEYLDWWLDWVDMFDDVKKQIYGDPPSVEALDTRIIDGKAAVAKWMGELTSIYNSLGLCMKVCSFTFAIGPTLYSKLYSSLTGKIVTPSELMKVGERIFNLMRAYLVREGVTRKDDEWPARFYEEPIGKGPAKGAVLSREEMNKALDEYYKLAGWDITTGIPTKRKLNELNLDYVADELSNLGFIVS
jgi:aldehyde:ferredoxin oxidoreductase